MAEAESETEAPEGEKKKGGAKKLIMMILPLLLIALVVAKMTVLKPAPLTKAQMETKAATEKYTLEKKCALANDLTPPKPPKDVEMPKSDASTTPTTTAEPAGPVLELDSKTLNLDGTHFLKIGVSLQLPAAAVPDEVKTTENWSSVAGQVAIDTFTGRSFDQLSADGVREQLEHQVGNEVCLKTEGKVTTVYFIDFVMQ